MANWHRSTSSDFEYDFEQAKLGSHGLTFNEAVECFFSDFEVRRNKKFKDRYQLLGKSIAGRRVKIVFQLKPKDIVRIIMGWPI